MERNSIIALLLIVIVTSPLITFAYLGSSMRASITANAPSRDAVFLTLKDFWYPADQETQVYPMFLMGEAGGYYKGSIVTLPSRVHIDVFAIDATNNTVDLTWIDAQSLHQLCDGESVNVSYTPRVNGTFGEEGVTYRAGTEQSELWSAQGDPTDIFEINFGGGLPRAEYQSHSHLAAIDLTFDLSPENHNVVWALLLGLVINRSDASAIAGHEINFMISYTYYWKDYFYGVLQAGPEAPLDFDIVPDNLTSGNGETYGQWDCGTIYVLEGSVEFSILDS
ncbi:MAG: hypothetical protein ACFFFO_16805 [Candidatus Thorarchaeota archaeon]